MPVCASKSYNYQASPKYLMCFFASVFYKYRQLPNEEQSGSKDRERDKHPRVVKGKVRLGLEKLDVFSLAGSDGMHPWVLKELTQVILKPFEKLQKSGEIMVDCKRTNIVPIL